MTTPGPASNIGSSQVIRYVDLDPIEAAHIEMLARRVVWDHGSSTAPSLLGAAAGVAHRFSPRLVDELRTFRLDEPAAAMLLRGLPVDDAAIGLTPLDWREQRNPERTAVPEAYLVLIGSLLGDIFGWSTLQSGRLIHDVLPIPTEQDKQSGHGTVKLEWHTEDGFHPQRCDYLLLLGLRNHDSVPTTLAGIDDVVLEPRHNAVLAQPRFLIRPDNEHLARAREVAERTGEVHWVQRMRDDPEPSAVLFGDPNAPYLRIDPVFMSALPGDDQAARALDALIAALDAALVEVPLDAGDLLIVDNYRAVHGRCAFRARFDGTDRWLKKVVITRDLRKSRAFRRAPGERVLR